MFLSGSVLVASVNVPAAGTIVPSAAAENAAVIGAGMLRILPQDFARQLTTFRGAGRGPLASIARFGMFFGKSVADAYLPPARSEAPAEQRARAGATK